MYLLSGSDFFPTTAILCARKREKEGHVDLGKCERNIYSMNYCAYSFSLIRVSPQSPELPPPVFLLSFVHLRTLIAHAISCSLVTNYNAHFKRARRRGLMKKDISGLPSDENFERTDPSRRSPGFVCCPARLSLSLSLRSVCYIRGHLNSLSTISVYRTLVKRRAFVR